MRATSGGREYVARKLRFLKPLPRRDIADARGPPLNESPLLAAAFSREGVLWDFGVPSIREERNDERKEKGSEFRSLCVKKKPEKDFFCSCLEM